MVGKSSAVASKDPQAVATTGQLTAIATIISDINFSSSAASKAEIALATKSVITHISAIEMEEFPQLMLRECRQSDSLTSATATKKVRICCQSWFSLEK